MKKRMKIILSILIIVLILAIFLGIMVFADENIIETKPEIQILDSELNILPEPEIDSISNVELGLTLMMDFEPEIKVVFYEPDGATLLSNNTYTYRGEYNQKEVISIDLRFDEIGASALIIDVFISYDGKQLDPIEVRRYLFIPEEYEGQSELLEKKVSFEEQKNISRVSEFPTKAHKPYLIFG